MTTKKMLTMNDLADALQSGFSALTPHESDIMGDSWSRGVVGLFEKTVSSEGISNDVNRSHAWLVFHALYCTLVGMESRIVSSPRAMEMSGIKVTDETKSEAIRILIASQNY